MAEGTYEYECMRAELLGVEKPTYDEFIKNQQEQDQQKLLVEEETHDIENLKSAEETTENYQHISGRLDELNSILKQTQNRISRFKVTCGSSLSNLFGRNKLFQNSAELAGKSDHESEATIDNQHQNGDAPSPPIDGADQLVTDNNSTNVRKSDLTRALDRHVDNLDNLIEKAENAHYSMSQQSKEMKKFLN